MKTQYKAFFIRPKTAKKGYYIVHPLTYKFGQLLRKATCVFSWGNIYAKLHVPTNCISSFEMPIVIRKDEA